MATFHIESIAPLEKLERNKSGAMSDEVLTWEPRELPKQSETEIYANPTQEQKILNDIYLEVQSLYHMTMFEAPPTLRGYGSVLLFDLDPSVFDASSANLQKMLSLLHVEIAIKKSGTQDLLPKLDELVMALETFNPEQSVEDETERQDVLNYLLKTKNLLSKFKKTLRKIDG